MESTLKLRWRGWVVSFALVMLVAAALFFGVSLPFILSHGAIALLAFAIARRQRRAPPQHEPATVSLQQTIERLSRDVQAMRRRLSLASSTAAIEIWEYDLATRSLKWHENHLTILGLHDVPADRYMDEFQKYANKDDWEIAQALIADTVHSGRTSCSYEFRFLRDGKTIHIRDRVYVQRTTDGHAEYLVGTSQDITAEVETRELLQQQAAEERVLRERLSVATVAAGIEMWEFDLRSAQFTWMHNRLPAFGLQHVPLDAYADSWNALIPPEDQQVIQETVERAAYAGENDCTYKFRVVRDGHTHYMQAYARIERDPLQRALRLRGATRNISHEVATTELLKKQNEQERALRDRLNIATRTAGIASWEMDFETMSFLWRENWQLYADENGPAALSIVGDRLHPDDRDKFSEMARAAARAGENTIAYRYRLRGEGERIHHVQNHARLLFNEAGELSGALGVSWDITQEVEAAQKLAEQSRHLQDIERRLERASLFSSEGHFEWNLGTGEAWYSSSFHTLLGYPPGDLPSNVEASLALIRLEEDREWQQRIFEAHVKTGSPYELECQLRSASGELRWFRIKGAAELDPQGRPIAIAGSMHDIHHQRLVERELKHARLRLERAINGTQDGLWELERSGAAWISPRLAELLGYRADELLADTNFLDAFLHPEDAATVAFATRAHYEEGAPYDVEIRLRTRQGDYRWFRARASAERDADGQPVRLSGSLQDVSDARAAREEVLRAMASAENANRAKSEFLANVSHEIRTPMNGIIGMSALLLDTYLDRTQHDYAATIHSSAESLLIIINDILDFSKIEAGKLALESLEFDLRENVEDVGSMMALQAATRNLELVIDIDTHAPARVQGDPQRVRQCLINLLGNAIKFTRTGEVAIAVSTPLIAQQRFLQFDVHDTGIGVAPEMIASLFQPFVQADSSTTRHFGGTGLGLSIVQRLAEMMGGTAGADSTPGVGSRFWFRIPLVSVATPNAPLELQRVGRRILIVDDNTRTRNAIEAILRAAGYEAKACSNAREALTLLDEAATRTLDFEAILIDQSLPEMDGTALAARLADDSRHAHLPRILLTSVDRHENELSGFSSRLNKPIRARELLACLDRTLAGGSEPISQRTVLASRALEAQPEFFGRVLLVEDNAVNQKVAVRFLERLGCAVRVASNGEEGVQSYAEGSFDLVLMDLQMPVMDGLAATARIRALEATQRARTPIVALTANAMAGQLEVCLAADMDGFLTKPLEVARLREVLHRFGLTAAAAASQHAAGQ